MGINVNGSLLTTNGYINYNLTTTGVKGSFSFYGGSFISGRPINQPVYSLQLNANFNVSYKQLLWVQDVAIVQKTRDFYNISIVDNLWNATGNTLPGVNGNGNVTNITISYTNYTFYYFVSPYYFLTKAPFNITLEMFIGTLKTDNYTYPQLLIYFSFSNSTYNSGLILYDKILVKLNSSDPQFLAGLFPNIDLKPIVLQFVIGGAGGGSGLYVYNWSSRMSLEYFFNGTWYSVPSAISLEPIYNVFGGETAEYVDEFDGINETYINNSVVQTAGTNSQYFLWITGVNISTTNNTLHIIATPSNAQWVIKVLDYRGSILRILNSSSKIDLSPGVYYVDSALYVGKNLVYSVSKKVIISGGIVTVYSSLPFYVQGQLYLPGKYSFRTPINITFIKYIYLSPVERYTLIGVNVSGEILNNASLLLYNSLTVSPVYVLQYYILDPVNATGYINGQLAYISSGWYNSGSVIYIPAQNVTRGFVRYIITQPLTVYVSSPTILKLKYYEEVYVNVSVPVYANVNGANMTITSGWYNYGSIIRLFRYYYLNSTARISLLTNGYYFNVTYPVVIMVYNETLEYMVNITLPNGSITLWLPKDYTLSLPSLIYINSTTRFELLTNNVSVNVTMPMVVSPLYVKEYLVTLIFPNESIKEWLRSGYILHLPRTIYISHSERYYLNGNGEINISGPLILKPPYVLQYLVIIKGNSYWYNNGTSIRLYEKTSPWYIVRWVGNYSVINGMNITVVGYLIETPVKVFDMLPFYLISFILAMVYVVSKRLIAGE
ncbi:MAG: thermopsin family protease [Sulfolobaceae archaeon]|nr:thermopsin family protease [Sulfolobaceae archaeon]